ncbi:hypothetical protein D3C87_2098230 [compost metagenome]
MLHHFQSMGIPRTVMIPQQERQIMGGRELRRLPEASVMRLIVLAVQLIGMLKQSGLNLALAMLA